eukprot:1732526-Rhodomonas_salina.1
MEGCDACCIVVCSHHTAHLRQLRENLNQHTCHVPNIAHTFSINHRQLPSSAPPYHDHHDPNKQGRDGSGTDLIRSAHSCRERDRVAPIPVVLNLSLRRPSAPDAIARCPRNLMRVHRIPRRKRNHAHQPVVAALLALVSVLIQGKDHERLREPSGARAQPNARDFAGCRADRSRKDRVRRERAARHLSCAKQAGRWNEAHDRA